MLKKIISGGQTGADQGALDACIELGFPYGGWVPKGRQTEAGPLPPKYHQMKEMFTTGYPDRTKQNVIDSDGTLILSHAELSGGSALTAQLAQEHKKPLKHIDLDEFRPLANADIGFRSRLDFRGEDAVQHHGTAVSLTQKSGKAYI